MSIFLYSEYLIITEIILKVGWIMTDKCICLA